MRSILISSVVLFVASSVRAQDLPLRDVLIDGQGWVTIAVAPQSERRPTPRGGPDMPFDGSVFGWIGPRPRVETAKSHDGATLFAVNGTDPWLYAVPCGDGIPAKAGSKYAPLRMPRGETKSGAGTILLDTAGRIYVATTVGIQVFEPTGRLCGVLHPTGDGPLDELAWTGPGRSTLTGSSGGKRYGRVLNVTGAP